MKFTNPVMLKDSLYNTSKDCAHSDKSVEYGKGIVVGMVSILMAQGLNLEVAFSIVCSFFPADFEQECIPESWRKR